MIEIINIPLILQIFVLINPLSSLPVLVAAHSKKMKVKEIALRATLIALSIAIAIIFIGPFLFSIFNISINSFRVAGGIILLLLGISTARRSDDPRASPDNAEALTSLIATPLLTGPATISFLTIKTYEIGLISILINTLASFLIVGLVFVIFAALIPKINTKVIGILSRILGLFLTAVAVEMITNGLKGIFIALVC
ncbi:MAG: MarC family protein [Candidatus Diapherotrites archaeon]